TLHHTLPSRVIDVSGLFARVICGILFLESPQAVAVIPLEYPIGEFLDHVTVRVEAVSHGVLLGSEIRQAITRRSPTRRPAAQEALNLLAPLTRREAGHSKVTCARRSACVVPQLHHVAGGVVVVGLYVPARQVSGVARVRNCQRAPVETFGMKVRRPG